MILDVGGIGGILLMLGAYALFKGKVMYSIALYFVADIMWLILAYRQDDKLGAFLIGIGMLLGVGVFLKAHYGIFHKDLNRKE